MHETANVFTLSVVYGPTGSNDKPQFLAELQAQKPPQGSQWLVLGDFNLIYKASDKNNNRLNFRLMNLFKQALDDSDLREVHMLNRRFIWSNER